MLREGGTNSFPFFIMHSDLFLIMAVYGLVFLAKDADIFDIPRQWLSRKSVWLFKLFHCAFCLGVHCGYIVYLLSLAITTDYFSIANLVLWALAGGACSYLLDRLLSGLHTH